MHSYKHHLGDYAKDTGHLSMLEHGAYRLLMDRCYGRELPLPKDRADVYRLAGARSRDEKKAVDAVLGEFFTEEPDGWHQKRIDEEIAAYRELSAKASESAKRRWCPPDAESMPRHADGTGSGSAKAMPTHMPTHSDGNAEAMLAISHKPLAKKNPETTPAVSTGETSAKRRPPAGAVHAEAGQANPAPDPGPRPIAAGLSIDALRTTPGVGTDQHAASGALWAVLAANSCKGTASHPAVIEMARAGVTVDELRRAIAEARKSTDGQLNPAYLAAIVERLRTDGAAPGKGRAGAWATDDSALEAKAKELGLWPTKAGSYHELRVLVRARLDKQAAETVR